MSALPDTMGRRQSLIARCDQERAELSAMLGGIENKFALAEAVVATARQLNRHRVLVGAAGLFVVFAPAVARNWIRRASWLAPLAIEGYRRFAAQPAAGRRDPSPPAETTR